MPPRPVKKLSPKKQAVAVLAGLEALYPSVRCGLNFRNPFELIVATVLSAQCTDARVNLVTPQLFVSYPNAVTLALAEPEQLEGLIYSTGFFRAKAKNLIGMANLLVAKYEGQIPADLDALTALPGVGRKTANVVLGNAFGIASGVVVDTHVKRLSYRLGLTDRTDPVHIERELNAILPRSAWVDFSHRLIDHGRKTCRAQRPQCQACALLSICPRNGLPALEPVESTGQA